MKRNLTIALSAAMLMSLASAANDVAKCTKCTKCKKCGKTVKAAKPAQEVKKSVVEIAREANADQIQRGEYNVNPDKKRCKRKDCKKCKLTVLFKYSPEKKYMAALELDENGYGIQVKVYDLDTKEVVLYLIPSTKVRGIEVTKDTLVVKWKGVFGKEESFSLKNETCKDCGKTTTEAGDVVEAKTLYGIWSSKKRK